MKKKMVNKGKNRTSPALTYYQYEEERTDCTRGWKMTARSSSKSPYGALGLEDQLRWNGKAISGKNGKSWKAARSIKNFPYGPRFGNSGHDVRPGPGAKQSLTSIIPHFRKFVNR